MSHNLVSWQELSPDVDLMTFPGGKEVIVKSFAWEGEFGGAFQEIAGGVCTTQYVNMGETENFCRVYDTFIAKVSCLSVSSARVLSMNLSHTLHVASL